MLDVGLTIANALEHALAAFRERATAGWLFAAMALACGTLCAAYYRLSIAPARRSLALAARAINSVSFLDANQVAGLEAEREARVDRALAAAAAESAAGQRILIAWRRRLAALHAGLPGGEEAIVRPSLLLGPNPRWLSTAADAFAGVGLVFTFLGLVAALGSAADAVAATQDGGRGALLQLLGAASVKFFTSIAGIGGAVVMRVWQAFWLSRIGAGCAALSADVDAHLYGVRRTAKGSRAA